MVEFSSILLGCLNSDLWNGGRYGNLVLAPWPQLPILVTVPLLGPRDTSAGSPYCRHHGGVGSCCCWGWYTGAGDDGSISCSCGIGDPQYIMVNKEDSGHSWEDGKETASSSVNPSGWPACRAYVSCSPGGDSAGWFACGVSAGWANGWGCTGWLGYWEEMATPGARGSLLVERSSPSHLPLLMGSSSDSSESSFCLLWPWALPSLSLQMALVNWSSICTYPSSSCLVSSLLPVKVTMQAPPLRCKSTVKNK